jgi:GntR family transcriptional regulator
MLPADMEALDRREARPLYQQLKDRLVRRIADGTWRPGDQIPTEAELCRLFGVSRMTVKQAVAELVREGVLYRRQGKGTFVAGPRIQQRLALTSFTEDMRRRGFEPSSRVLALGVVPASRQLAEILRVPVESPVWRLERLRLADGQAVALQTAHLPASLCPVVDAQAVAEGSLYRYLEERYDLRPARAVETYTAVVAREPRCRQLLGVDAGAPLLHVERVTFLRDGRPMESVQSFLRGDRYSLRVELQA